MVVDITSMLFANSCPKAKPKWTEWDFRKSRTRI